MHNILIVIHLSAKNVSSKHNWALFYLNLITYEYHYRPYRVYNEGMAILQIRAKKRGKNNKELH